MVVIRKCIIRRDLTVITKELANSVEQPLSLLSIKVEVKISLSPELDFFTGAPGWATHFFDVTADVCGLC